MKIINSTPYNTEDLRNLILTVREVCWVQHKAQIDKWREQANEQGRPFNEDSDYYKILPLPDTLRVGLYRSKKVDAKAMLVKPRSNCPRLGIANLEKLGVPAMLVLAAAAVGPGDGEPSLDVDAIQPIAEAVALMCRGSLRRDDVEGWARINRCRVRFTTFKTDTEVKVAETNAQIANLHDKLRIVEAELDHYRNKVTEFQDERNTLLDKINKLEGRNAYVLKC